MPKGQSWYLWLPNVIATLLIRLTIHYFKECLPYMGIAAIFVM